MSYSNFTMEYDLPIDTLELGVKFGGRKVSRDQRGKIISVEHFIFEVVFNDTGKLVARKTGTSEIFDVLGGG